MSIFSSITETVCDFPEPCTPHTSAENGAFYKARGYEYVHQLQVVFARLTVFTYSRGSSGTRTPEGSLSHLSWTARRKGNKELTG